MGVITFNGRSSDEFNCTIEQRPNHTRGSRRGELIEVPGRNGAMVLEDGSYTTYIQSYVMAFKEGDTLPPYRRAAQVAEWLLGSKGFCRLEDDFEPGFFRLARYAGPLNINQVVDAYGRCTLEFECQPQRYLKSGESEYSINTPYSDENISIPGQIRISPVPPEAAGAYVETLNNSGTFAAVFLDENGSSVGSSISSAQGEPVTVPSNAVQIYCVWNNQPSDFSLIVGLADETGGKTPLCGVDSGSPVFFNPTANESRPLLEFTDVSTEPRPVYQTLVPQYGKRIERGGVIRDCADTSYYVSELISVSGYAKAIVSNTRGYAFLNSQGVPFGNPSASYSTHQELAEIAVPTGAASIVVGGNTNSGTPSLALQPAREDPGASAATINGTTVNLDFSEHDVIFLDCERHDAYYIDGSSANSKVSFASAIDQYPTFPGFIPGENDVLVGAAASVRLSVVPRWWSL